VSPPSLIELILRGLIFGIRDFVVWLWLLVQQLIELPAVFEVAINIALFSFLGFLLYERVLGATKGKSALDTASVRKFARTYLTSTLLLFFAYCLAYLRGVGWVAATFGSWTLRDLEGLTGFLGFVTLLWPLYPLFRLLSGRESIRKAALPELDQILWGGILALGYASLAWGLQVTGQRDLFGRLVQCSLLLGALGTIGTVWLTNKPRHATLSKAFLILTMNPLFSVIFLIAIHGWGLI